MKTTLLPPLAPFDAARRRLLWGLPALPAALAACGTPLPLAVAPRPGTAGEALLMASAHEHGWDAYRRVRDINVAYDGAWRPFIDRIQPVVVDRGYRGRSEERLLPPLGVNAQRYQGPRGVKQVFWQRGGGNSGASGAVGVWYDGAASADPAVLAASALVAECYALFLLGPLWLAGRGLAAEHDGTERVHGRLCDRVHVWLRPGLGQVALDRVTVCIDRDDAVTRRLRFTLEGFAATRGAVAEVDTFEHRRLWGVLWPMRSYEEVVHPLRVPAHDWFLTGLDLDRGHGPQALNGPTFTGPAAAPAAALPA